MSRRLQPRDYCRASLRYMCQFLMPVPCPPPARVQAVFAAYCQGSIQVLPWSELEELHGESGPIQQQLLKLIQVSAPPLGWCRGAHASGAQLLPQSAAEAECALVAVLAAAASCDSPQIALRRFDPVDAHPCCWCAVRDAGGLPDHQQPAGRQRRTQRRQAARMGRAWRVRQQAVTACGLVWGLNPARRAPPPNLS